MSKSTDKEITELSKILIAKSLSNMDYAKETKIIIEKFVSRDTSKISSEKKE